jgi:hypothetical protein
MNAVGAVRQILLDDAITVDLLFDPTSIYPTVLPQEKQYPAVILMIGDAKPNDSKTETSPIDNVQIWAVAYSKTYDLSQQIDTAIRNAIDGFAGGVTTSDSAVHYIDAIRFMSRKDDFDEENVLFVRQCVYDVRYYREIPPLPFGGPRQKQSAAFALWNNDGDAKAGGIDERGVTFAPLGIGDIYLTGPKCDFAPYGMFKVIME